MDFYHASTHKYDVGEVVTARLSPNTKYYVQANIELDSKRPKNMADRDSSLYVTNDDSFAYHFIKKQYPKDTCYVYKISVDVIPDRHPFAVVHQIESRIQGCKNFSDLVSEYWNPQQEWSFFEYLVPEFKILEVVPFDCLDDVTASILYNADVIKAENL